MKTTYTQEQLERAVWKAGEYFTGIYLDWRRFSLGINVFAADHNMSPKQARQYIEIGRKVHEHKISRLSK